MGGDRPAIGRRRLLLGSAAGGAAMFVGTSAAADAAEGDGAEALGTVTRSSEPGASTVAVRVGERVFDVHPLDFPEGWQFAAGDRLLVDLDQDVAYPFVRTSDDGRGIVVLNEDPSLERLMGSSPA
jgi:hypothetical protein